MAIVGAFAIIVLLCWSAFGYYGAMSENGKDAAVTEIPRKAQLYRDIAILCLTVIGMAMVAWRSYSLNKQANAANEQAKTAADQFALANDRLYSDQFASAAESMSKESKDGKSLIAARISGIYVMLDLATKLPAEFAERVVKNLIAYIKDNARRKLILPKFPKAPTITMYAIGGDVKAAFAVLSDILGNEKIKEHVADRFLDFSEHNFSGLDFQGIDLSHYKKWTGASFRQCNLSGVHFKDADMQHVDFSGAVLRGATLESVNMTRAVMKEADLTEITMADVNLSIADLRGAVLIEAPWQWFVNLSFARMQGCYMRRINLQKQSLKGAKLTGACLEGDVELNSADMTGANLQGAVLVAKLQGADLRDASFGETDMRFANFAKDQLSEQIKQAVNRRIWHSATTEYYPWVEGIEKRPDDTPNWSPAISEDGYALAGFLANFAAAPEYTKESRILSTGQNRVLNPEIIQQQAARVKPEHIPDDTPEVTKAWLKEIRAKYSGR